MNKIFNWTFGSFFRTIGRTIALLLLGGLFYYILSSNGIGITDLFFDKVNASGYTSMDFTWSNNGSALPTYSGWPTGYNGYDMGTNYTQGTLIFYATTNQSYVTIPNGTKNISINAIFDIPISQTNWGQSGGLEAISSNLLDIQLITNGTWSTCNVTKNIQNNNINNNYEIICPIQNNVTAIQAITIFYRFENIDQYNAYIGLGRRATFEINDTQSIIDNQNQNTQSVIQSQNETQQAIQETANQTQETIKQETNKTIETITDSSSPDLNGTLDNDTVAGWLPAGPLDSLLNLPLTLFNSLTRALGGTCADLVVPLPFVNKNLNIPCMIGIYSSMGFGSFFNWIGVIASAFILFSYLMKLYKWVDDTLTFRENNHLDNWGGV